MPLRASRQHLAAPATVAAAAAAAAVAALFVVQIPSTSGTDAASATVAAATPSRVPIAVSEGRAAQRASRSAVRSTLPAAEPTPTPTPKPSVPEKTGTRYASVALNVRTGPSTDAAVVDVLAAGAKVAVSGRPDDGWQRVVHERKARWVKASYLAAKPPARQPKAKATSARSGSGGISTAPCSHGSQVERGLAANGVDVHRAICARWPQITSFGGTRGGSGSNHNTGHALDVMVSGGLGDEVAAWLRANARALGVTELLWEQRIWTAQRSGDGWRALSDRGSATANHYDHVHVSVS